MPFKRECDTCAKWIDFLQFYDDPEEPDDFGHCQEHRQEKDATSKNDCCEYYILHPDLVGFERRVKCIQ